MQNMNESPPLYVKRRNNLGKCQILSDRSRHSNLIDTKIGIGSDDRTSREIDAFAHQIPSDTTFFPLQALLNRFQRTAGLLRGLQFNFTKIMKLISLHECSSTLVNNEK